MRDGQLVVSDVVKWVAVHYHDDNMKVIVDEYTIDQLDQLLTATSLEEEQEINQLLNMENKYE